VALLSSDFVRLWGWQLSTSYHIAKLSLSCPSASVEQWAIVAVHPEAQYVQWNFSFPQVMIYARDMRNKNVIHWSKGFHTNHLTAVLVTAVQQRSERRRFSCRTDSVQVEKHNFEIWSCVLDLARNRCQESSSAFMSKIKMDVWFAWQSVTCASTLPSIYLNCHSFYLKFDNIVLTQ